jgi:hypothetical protein
LAKTTAESNVLKASRKREQITELYRTRLSYLKKAQLFVREDKISQAVDSYTRYLDILALFFDTSEDKLSPSFFDPKKDVTELLLISHAYWDLAKAYDRSPNMQRECFRCLESFVKFSIGFKYQHVNAQIIRKFNNKKQAHNPKAFEAAYHKLQISSKKCYIATSCFGEDDLRTQLLREFKLKIAPFNLGKDFIDFYYQISPFIVQKFDSHSRLKWFCEFFFIKPILQMFIFFIRPYVQHNKTNS